MALTWNNTSPQCLCAVDGCQGVARKLQRYSVWLCLQGCVWVRSEPKHPNTCFYDFLVCKCFKKQKKDKERFQKEIIAQKQ